MTDGVADGSMATANFDQSREEETLYGINNDPSFIAYGGMGSTYHTCLLCKGYSEAGALCNDCALKCGLDEATPITPFSIGAYTHTDWTKDIFVRASLRRWSVPDLVLMYNLNAAQEERLRETRDKLAIVFDDTKDSKIDPAWAQAVRAKLPTGDVMLTVEVPEGDEDEPANASDLAAILFG